MSGHALHTTACHIDFQLLWRSPPPPPPVLEMDATFNLELVPGQYVALDTLVSSDELDMARMEDGTTVDGSFWGKLDIVHDGWSSSIKSYIYQNLSLSYRGHSQDGLFWHSSTKSGRLS